ncbi:MAG: hypothetical protein ABI837_17560 [Acidobacteriota bacterium]
MQATMQAEPPESDSEVGADQQGVCDFEVVTEAMEVDDEDDEELTFTDDE